MRPINVVLAHHDAVAADRLTASLAKQFRNLEVAKSAGEIAPAVARLRAPFVVVDLEMVGLPQLKSPLLGVSLNRLRVHPPSGGRSHVVRSVGYGCGGLLSLQRPAGILLASERYVVLSHTRSVAA